MAEKEFDPWRDLESGRTTDYEGVIGEAFFQPGDYGYQLVVKFLTDDPDHSEVTEFYGLGGGWYSADGGITAEHPDMEKNPRKNFHANSGYGKLIGRAAQLMIDAGEDPRKLGDPRKAEVWLRTSWFMEEVENVFKDRETGKERVTVKNYPSKYLGMTEAGSDATAASSSPKASTSSPPSTTVPVDTPTKVRLTMLAKKAPSHGEWLEDVLDKHAELFEDATVNAWLADEATYTTLKG